MHVWSHDAILFLYCDERRAILWNIAWARGKSRGGSPRDFPRAQAIFNSISRLESQYRHSHLASNGPALAVAYAEVTAISGNADIALAVELIASVEAVFCPLLKQISVPLFLILIFLNKFFCNTFYYYRTPGICCWTALNDRDESWRRPDVVMVQFIVRNFEWPSLLNG